MLAIGYIEEKLGEIVPKMQELNKLREQYKDVNEQAIPEPVRTRIDDLNIQVNQTQSEALFFANEAYHTGGPVEHVVLNQQMRLRANLNPQKLSLSINEQTGFIMEQTEHVGSDNPQAFGKSLWKSAKYLDRICDAAEKLNTNETNQKIPDPELQKISQMGKAAKELLKIKKNPVMDDNAKSQAALEIVKGIGLTNVTDYKQRVLELSVILNRRISSTRTEE